jgi:large subunit ribosomal protein L22
MPVENEKTEQIEKIKPKAILKFARISSRKVKIVADTIRGKNVNVALAMLKYTPKAAAPILEKLLKSAIANAENNLGMQSDNLVISEIFANQGPTMRRIRPAAKGSAVRIRKRTSHITIILDEKV